MQMRVRSFLPSSLRVAAFFILAAGTAASVHGQTFYTIPPFGGVGVGNISNITAMTADGTLVAGQSLDSNNVITPFTWAVGGNTTAFADTDVATNVLPRAISYSGNTVIIGGSAANATSLTVPFVYNGTTFHFLSITGVSSNATSAFVTGLGTPGNTTVPLTVNAISGNTTSGNLFLANFDAGNYGSGGSQGNLTGGFFGVSLNGTSAAAITGTGGNRVAAVFIQGSSPVSSLPFGNRTSGSISGNFGLNEVDGISANGQYVFGIANTTIASQSYRRGFIFDSTVQNSTIKDPLHPADTFAAVRAVTSDGVGVGISGNTAVFANERAVIYHPTLGTLGLKTVLEKVYGVSNSTLVDWELNEARFVSSDGTVVSGVGTFNGNQTGFLVTLPSALLNLSVATLTILDEPATQTININGNVSFSVTALAGNTSSGNLTYQWFHDGTALPGATTSNITLAKQGLAAGGDYVVQVSDGTTTTNSTAAVLTINNNLPIITSQPKAVNNVKLGGNLTLSVTASNAVSYQWFFANATTSFSIIGGGNRVYTANNISLIMVGNYTCQITNGNGTVTSNVAVVNALYPPKVTKQPVAVTITPGKLLRLTVTATGYPVPHYQWIHNNRSVGGKAGRSSTYQVKPAHQPDSGSYRVKVSNSQGFAYSKWVVVTVAPKTGGGNTTGGNTTGG